MVQSIHCGGTFIVLAMTPATVRTVPAATRAMFAARPYIVSVYNQTRYDGGKLSPTYCMIDLVLIDMVIFSTSSNSEMLDSAIWMSASVYRYMMIGKDRIARFSDELKSPRRSVRATVGKASISGE